MKTLSEVPDYSDLKREVEALRKRLEDLESGRMHPKPAGRAPNCWRFLRRPVWALAAVVVGFLLALGVLGAQNDPLFIGPNGTVSIGSARFSNIGINQDPWPGQKMIITADGTDIPLNVTNPANTVSWLVVSKDGKVLMNGGNVGVVGAPGSPGFDISKASPKLAVSGSSLLSNGTGESWFPYYDGNSYVSGTNVILRSNGNTERMRLTSGGDIGIGTTAPNAKLDVNGTVAAGGLAVGSQGITVATGGMIQGRLWSKEFRFDARANSNNTLSMTKVATSVCFLTGLWGSLVGRGEMAKIREAGERWELQVKQGNQAGLEATAMCIGSPE